MLSHILPPNPADKDAIAIIDSEDEQHFSAVVEHLCTKHDIAFSQFNKLAGWANVLFDIDDSVILKIAAPNWALQSKREIQALQLLADKTLPVAVPKLLFHGEINGWIYFFCNKLKGDNLHDLWPTIDKQGQLSLMAQVGRFARGLNDIAVTATGPLAVDWPEFLSHYSGVAYQRRRHQGLTGPLLEDINPFLNKVDYQGERQQPMLLHCDLHAGNLLAEQIDGQWQLTGVIDFGDSLISTDRQYELISTPILMGLGDKTLNQAFFDGYGFTVTNPVRLQQELMVLSLIRHSGEMGYVLNQVKGSAELTAWQNVAMRFFAL